MRLRLAERSETLMTPERGSVPHNLALIAMSHWRLGQPEKAAEAMKKLEELMEQPSWAKDEEAIGLQKEAKQLLDQPAEPADEQAAWVAFKSHLAEQDLDPGKYATWLADMSRLLGSRGYSDLAKSWASESVATLRSLVKASPDSYVAYWRLGTALAAEGNYDEAIEELQHSVKLQPRSPIALAALTEAFRQAGKPEAAIPALEQILARDAKNTAALSELGSLQRELGKLNESQDTLRKALRIDPTDARAAFELQRTKEALAETPQPVEAN